MMKNASLPNPVHTYVVFKRLYSLKVFSGTNTTTTESIIMKIMSNLKILSLLRVVYVILASIIVYIQFQTVRFICYYLHSNINTFP